MPPERHPITDELDAAVIDDGAYCCPLEDCEQSRRESLCSLITHFSKAHDDVEGSFPEKALPEGRWKAVLVGLYDEYGTIATIDKMIPEYASRRTIGQDLHRYDVSLPAQSGTKLADVLRDPEMTPEDIGLAPFPGGQELATDGGGE